MSGVTIRERAEVIIRQFERDGDTVALSSIYGDSMNRHKTRPTLDELKQMPLVSLRREIAQLCVDAAIADHAEVLADAEMLAMDPDPLPERIVELWNVLRGPLNQTCLRCGAQAHSGYELICTCK